MQRTRRRRLFFSVGILISMFWFWYSLAMANTLTSYTLVRNVSGSGGQAVSGQRVALNGTIGQPVVGMSEAVRCATQAGYWQAQAPGSADIPAETHDHGLYLPLVLFSGQ